MRAARARRTLVTSMAVGVVVFAHAATPAVAGGDDPSARHVTELQRPMPPAPPAPSPSPLMLPGRGPTPAPIPLVEPGEPGPVPIPLVEPRGPGAVPMPHLESRPGVGIAELVPRRPR